MSILPRLIASAEELRAGDFVRISKGKTVLEGPLELKLNDLRLADTSIAPRIRLQLGWTVELISREVPKPAEGLYVWRDMIDSNGLIPAHARVVKWKGYWTDAKGGGSIGEAREAWEAGKLFGPLKVQLG